MKRRFRLGFVTACTLLWPLCVAAQDSHGDTFGLRSAAPASIFAESKSSTASRLAAPQGSGFQPEFWRVEVYGGFGYANLSSSVLASRKHAGGWGASVTANLSRYFGLTADFAGAYDPECSEQDVNCFLDVLRTQQITDYSAHYFMGGPRFYIPRGNKRVFLHALVGGARTHSSVFDLSTNMGSSATSGPNLAMAIGGGFDWTIGERVAIRLIQVDAVPVREGSNWRNTVRIQFGAVFRFKPRE